MNDKAGNAVMYQTISRSINLLCTIFAHLTSKSLIDSSNELDFGVFQGAQSIKSKQLFETERANLIQIHQALHEIEGRIKQVHSVLLPLQSSINPEIKSRPEKAPESRVEQINSIHNLVQQLVQLQKVWSLVADTPKPVILNDKNLQEKAVPVNTAAINVLPKQQLMNQASMPRAVPQHHTEIFTRPPLTLARQPVSSAQTQSKASNLRNLSNATQ